MSPRDTAIDAYERTFGKRELVTRKELATFFACSVKTVDRRFAGMFLSCPGGVRIPRAAVINAME